MKNLLLQIQSRPMQIRRQSSFTNSMGRRSAEMIWFNHGDEQWGKDMVSSGGQTWWWWILAVIFILFGIGWTGSSQFTFCLVGMKIKSELATNSMMMNKPWNLSRGGFMESLQEAEYMGMNGVGEILTQHSESDTQSEVWDLLTFKEPVVDTQEEENIVVARLKLCPGNETWVMEEVKDEPGYYKEMPVELVRREITGTVPASLT
jgi:hypothetical protein